MGMAMAFKPSFPSLASGKHWSLQLLGRHYTNICSRNLVSRRCSRISTSSFRDQCRELKCLYQVTTFADLAAPEFDDRPLARGLADMGLHEKAEATRVALDSTGIGGLWFQVWRSYLRVGNRLKAFCWCNICMFYRISFVTMRWNILGPNCAQEGSMVCSASPLPKMNAVQILNRLVTYVIPVPRLFCSTWKIPWFPVYCLAHIFDC